jgi:hypothetical protein
MKVAAATQSFRVVRCFRRSQRIIKGAIEIANAVTLIVVRVGNHAQMAKRINTS